ncbi:T9SS C-terminal target domain-containing protein [Aquimarina sp. AD1]|uniref:Ig-like domain-containing protein n=1 Tax=Aquimarina sp. (strain AD1) TaxID=1714848 RepID=UPI000E47C56D|nr:Ig-like domain-containing protein [Aquimarina sp. AD1]AXT54869.1 T9SS C-terminal target domain-containing protein [Aquimarina sp. AD1]RKN13714.1 T9SS C-terminal target domain-containing protein [Aquimarina sp. AD1]
MKLTKNRVVRILLLFIILLIISNQKINSQSIEKSSVFITKPENNSIRNEYNVTNIAWGFLPLANLEAQMSSFINLAEQIDNEGRKLHGRIEFDAGWLNFAEFCIKNEYPVPNQYCSTIEENFYQYPWFEGKTHLFRGRTYKPFWISSHSPAFIAFLKYQIRNVIKAPIDVMLMDAQTSSAHASLSYNLGDFSEHSLKAFRNYLKNKYTISQLTDLGVNDINTFDYRQFLKQKGINTDQKYINKVKSHSNTPVPLFDDFQLFQNESIKQLTIEMIDYAKNLKPTLLFGTSSPLQENLRATNIAEVDYFMLEQPMITKTFNREPELSYKLAEIMDKSVILTALPSNWNDIRTKKIGEENGLQWIAEAYANGANFILPYNQYTGKDANYIPTIDYTGISKYIRNNATLLNKYKAVKGKVGVVQFWEGGAQYNKMTNDICNALKQANVTYDIIPVGKVYIKNNPTFNQINTYEKVIIANDVYTNGLSTGYPIKNTLDRLNDKLFKWQRSSSIEDITTIKQSLSTNIEIQKNNRLINDKLTVLPRISEPNKPYVVHLVNQSLDPDSGNLITYSDVTLTLDDDLFENSITSAKLFLPNNTVQELEITKENSKTSIKGLNNIKFWGILELKHSGDSDTNEPPELVISKPKDLETIIDPAQEIAIETGTIFEGDNIVIEAEANDPDGEIQEVSLFLNGELIRTDTEAPYSWGGNAKLKNVEIGNYRFRIVAIDNLGKRTKKIIKLTALPRSLRGSDFDEENTGAIMVTPNPVSKGSGITIYQKGNKYLRLYDVTGKKIMKLDVSSYQLDLNISKLSSGMYILKSDTVTSKFIIQ